MRTRSHLSTAPARASACAPLRAPLVSVFMSDNSGAVRLDCPLDQAIVMSARIPLATYRLQFNAGFTLEHAAALIDYLRDLGISDCYASPLALAHAGSNHGYDVTDYSVINPEVGGEEQLAGFARRLNARTRTDSGDQRIHRWTRP